MFQILVVSFPKDRKMNNTPYNEEEQEISLIDLLAVIVRHRLLIIFGTLATVALVIFGMIIFPLVFPSKSVRRVAVTYTLKTKELPSNIQLLLGSEQSSVTQQTISILNDKVFFTNQYKKFLKDEDCIPEDDYEYNALIQEYQKKNYSISKGEAPGTILITFTVPDVKEQYEKVSSFMEDTVEIVNNDLMSKIFPQISSLLTLSRKTNPEEVITQDSNQSFYQQNQNIVLQLEYILNEYDSIVELDTIPYIIPSEQRSSLWVVFIVAFASFFLFVFIAFALNAVKNVKKDPHACKILNNAWHRKD